MKTQLLALILLLSTGLFAQDQFMGSLETSLQDTFSDLIVQESAEPDTSWKTGGVVNLNFGEVLLRRWAAGGQSSINGVSLINYSANYAKGNNAWDNTLSMAYGMLLQLDNDNFLKTDDRLDFTSKYGRKASEDWYYSALLNFRTQFAPGYEIVDGKENRDNKISDLLAPGYLVFALGMDYKPNDNFFAFISPVTSKTTFVMDQDLADAGQFGVDAATFDELGVKTADGANIRSEFGGLLRMGYNKNLMENVGLVTTIDLFSNYLNNPQNIDVNWETLISMKVNEIINVAFGTVLIYDHDIQVQKEAAVIDADGVTTTPAYFGRDVQFKQTLAVGVSFQI